MIYLFKRTFLPPPLLITVATCEASDNGVSYHNKSLDSTAIRNGIKFGEKVLYVNFTLTYVYFIFLFIINISYSNTLHLNNYSLPILIFIIFH